MNMNTAASVYQVRKLIERDCDKTVLAAFTLAVYTTRAEALQECLEIVNRLQSKEEAQNRGLSVGRRLELVRERIFQLATSHEALRPLACPPEALEDIALRVAKSQEIAPRAAAGSNPDQGGGALPGS